MEQSRSYRWMTLPNLSPVEGRTIEMRGEDGSSLHSLDRRDPRTGKKQERLYISDGAMRFSFPFLPETLTCCALPYIALRRGPGRSRHNLCLSEWNHPGCSTGERPSDPSHPRISSGGDTRGGVRHLVRSRGLTTGRPQRHKNSPIVLICEAYPSTRAAN